MKASETGCMSASVSIRKCFLRLVFLMFLPVLGWYLAAPLVSLVKSFDHVCPPLALTRTRSQNLTSTLHLSSFSFSSSSFLLGAAYGIWTYFLYPYLDEQFIWSNHDTGLMMICSDNEGKAKYCNLICTILTSSGQGWTHNTVYHKSLQLLQYANVWIFYTPLMVTGYAKLVWEGIKHNKIIWEVCSTIADQHIVVIKKKEVYLAPYSPRLWCLFCEAKTKPEFNALHFFLRLVYSALDT